MEDIPARVFSCDTTFAFDIRPYAINFYEVKALNDNHQCSYEDVEHSPEEMMALIKSITSILRLHDEGT